MKVELDSHLLETLLWLQHQLQVQDNEGMHCPVFWVLEHAEGTACERAAFLTRFMAEKYLAAERSKTPSRLSVCVGEGDDNPEIRFLRDLVLGIELVAHMKEPRKGLPPSSPVVLYFADDQDRDEFIGLLKEVKDKQRCKSN